MIKKKFGKTLKNSVLSKSTLVGIMLALSQGALAAVDNIDVSGGSGTITFGTDQGTISGHSAIITAPAMTTATTLTVGSGVTMGDVTGTEAGLNLNALNTAGHKFTLQIDGTVNGPNTGFESVIGGRAGADFSGGVDIVISSTGVINSAGCRTIDFSSGSVSGSINISNHGTIYGSTVRNFEAVYLSGSNVYTFDHYGTITTTKDSAAINIQNNSFMNSYAGSTIVTSGDSGHGIELSSNGNELNLNGAITTTGAGSYGVFSDGGNNTINMGGSILTSGVDADGVSTGSGDGNVINITGSISTSNDDSDGVYLEDWGVDHEVNVSGTIDTGGNNAHAIYSEYDNNSVNVTSTGILTTTGNGSHGVYAEYEESLIVLAGDITTNGAASHGIYMDEYGETAHLSGNLTANGAGSYAILESGSNSGAVKNAYNFLDDATINGGIAINTSAGNDAVLTFGFKKDGNKADFTDFDSAADITINGNITATSTGGWHGVFAGGTTTLNGTTNNFSSVTIGADELDGTHTVATGLGNTAVLNSVAGVATLNVTNDMNVAGNMILGAGSMLGLTVSDSTYSSVAVGGDLTIALGAKFNVSGTVSGEINHPVVTYGGTLTVDEDDKTAEDFDFDAAYLDTAILDITLHHVAGGVGEDGTLYLTIAASDIAPKGTTPGQEGIGKILDDITGGGTPSPEMDTMISTIQNLGTDAEVSQALQELSPVQMTAAPVAVLAATQSLGDVISGHVGNVSAGVTANRTASTNVKSGNGNVLMNVDTPPVRENEKWVPFFETFRSWGDQDDKDGISGYDFTTTGFVLGTDYLIDDRLLVGFSISKMDTTVDSNDNLATTDIDTWQGNVYGSYFTDTWHFDAHAGYGIAQIDSERSISFMGATAESDHDAPFYTVGVGAGYIFRPAEGMTLEPFCELDYMQMNEESYKEKGAGGANLEIDENDIESLRSKLGVRLAQRIEFEDGLAITPEFSYKWQHEFENDAIASSASFLNGGSSFKTTGMEPDADHHIFGAGIKAEVSDSVNIYANYEYDVSDTFSSNNALVGIEFKF